jgi:septin family protein
LFLAQSGDTPQKHPLTETEKRLLKHHIIRREERGKVEVVVPVDEEDDTQELMAQEDKAESGSRPSS